MLYLKPRVEIAPLHRPSTQRLLDEVDELGDFNNLHMHLPTKRGFYEQIYFLKKEMDGEDSLKDETKILPSLWQAVDDFVYQTGFDVKAFEEQFERGQADQAAHDRAQRALIPLYVFLRARGFSQERLTR